MENIINMLNKAIKNSRKAGNIIIPIFTVFLVYISNLVAGKVLPCGAIILTSIDYF